MRIEITDEECVGQRLDVFLVGCLPDFSRSQIKALVNDGHIVVDGKKAKPNKSLKLQSVIKVRIPEPEEVTHVPEDLPLKVLYEDATVMVVDKSSGMVVHPGSGIPNGTLVNALLFHCDALSKLGGEDRPGIVHRLDKDTSGCIVVAKTDAAHRSLSAQFAERKVSKDYLAVVERRPPSSSGRIVNRIGRDPANRLRMAVVEAPLGKPALTEYQTILELADCASVQCRLLTGRTHQIRVHMKSIGCPILGDEVYARPSRQVRSVPRLMLHAWKLGFIHPETRRPVAFCAEIPCAFHAFLPSSE
ncbi:MAG: RluA family pseudouridine synthase [Verrucomicrobiota bacterium]